MIDPRFRGPAESANGGYASGLVAGFLAGAAEVTLRRPPPLARALRVGKGDEVVEVFDDGEVVAEARPAEVQLAAPDPVAFAVAEQASRDYPGFREHAYPSCFVCGPQRDSRDGLRIFAGPVPGKAVFASPWIPDESLADESGRVAAEFVWAALDCPGAIAVGQSERGEWLLGQLAARVDSVPSVGDRCVVVSWPLGRDGRKGYAGTAVFSEDGRLHALARATWIEPHP